MRNKQAMVRGVLLILFHFFFTGLLFAREQNIQNTELDNFQSDFRGIDAVPQEEDPFNLNLDETFRTAETQVAVQGNETVMLGGLREKNTREEPGVPVLHRIPLVGRLFRASAEKEPEPELLVQVTPQRVTLNED